MPWISWPPARPSVSSGGRRRLHAHDADIRALLLEEAARTGQGAAGADARHEHVHLAFGILPDLGAGGAVMGAGVGRVFKLAQHQRAGDLPRQRFRPVHGALHAGRAGRQNDLCAVGRQQLAALHAHGLGHDEHGAVASGRRHGGQADAGVARGGLDNGRAGLKNAPLLRVEDHAQGDAVLGAAGGFCRSSLARSRAERPRFFRVILQSHQRRAADELRHILIDHGFLVLTSDVFSHSADKTARSAPPPGSRPW